MFQFNWFFHEIRPWQMCTMESKNYFLFKIECWSQYRCLNFQQNSEILKESRAAKAWLYVIRNSNHSVVHIIQSNLPTKHAYFRGKRKQNNRCQRLCRWPSITGKSIGLQKMSNNRRGRKKKHLGQMRIDG